MENVQIHSKEELTDALITEYIARNEYLDVKQKEFILKFAKFYIKDNSYLFDLYMGIQNKRNFVIDEENKVTYEYLGEKCNISIDGDDMDFNVDILIQILPYLIDICEDVLPLGSCVELKKEYFKDVFDITKVNNVRITITYRFVKSDNTYYTYAGVVYPVGNFNTDKIIKFTPTLIKKVLHRGYSDEQEDAYVYLMKNEYILEDKMKSAGYGIGGQDGNKS